METAESSTQLMASKRRPKHTHNKQRADVEYKTYRSRVKNTKLVKLKPENLQIYSVLMETSGSIKKLKPKHFKNSKNEYTDQAYFNSEPAYTGTNMTIGGVIEVLHGQSPHTHMNHPWHKDTVEWEPVKIIMGDWKFNNPTKRQEKKVPMHVYRSSLISEVRRSAPGGKGDLSTYFGETMAHTFPLYNNLIGGRLSLRHGIYIKCNCCGAFTGLPTLLTDAYTSRDEDNMVQVYHKPITPRIVCDIIEGIENFPVLGNFNFKTADIPEGQRSVLDWMLAVGSINCYNCGWHVMASQFVKPDFYVITLIPYNDYGINAMTLEKFKLCLQLDMPPPPELRRSFQTQDTFNNAEISRVSLRLYHNHCTVLV